MTGIRYALYQLLKVLVRTILFVLHPRMRVIGKGWLDLQHPTVVVGNHPNTMIDPLRIVSLVQQPVFFLANASLFKNPLLGRVLNYLYCIPIQRPKDVGGKPLRNQESFARSYAHLASGGNLFIAPEGGSELERRLREIKTGTARIALGAEEQNDFNLGIRILPICINYESPTNCFSRVLVRVGEPLVVSEWQNDYERDPIGTVRNLTAVLAERMQALLVHTHDKSEERLLRRIERSAQHDRPLSVLGHHHRSQAILRELRQLHDRDEAAYAQLADTTAAYDEATRTAEMSDLALSQHPRRRPDLWTLLGLPIFLYGWINHALAIYLPHVVWMLLKIDRGYETTVKIGVGMLTFPLFYILQTWLVSVWLGSGWALLYLLTLPLAGYLAWRYWEWSQPFWVNVLSYLRPIARTKLARQRAAWQQAVKASTILTRASAGVR